MNRYRPDLAGIPETMLWTLYGRVGEATRPDGLLRDPEAVRIYDSLDYDFEKRFGSPNILFAIRAALIDSELRRWLKRHPTGMVVSLGEGLETQAMRVDNGRLTWLSVDLPEAIRAREMFLQPQGRLQHLAADALDCEWIEATRSADSVFIVAQGLFMYLEPAAVERLIATIAARLPGAHVVFDIVSRSISEMTLAGHWHTADYRLPPMPWGLDRHEVRPTLRHWLPGHSVIRHLPYRLPSHRPLIVEQMLDALLRYRRPTQSLVHVVI